MHPRPRCSIILPCLNEEGSLPSLAENIVQAMRGQSYEVVFVDDGSTDGTWNMISQLLRQHPDWQGLRLSRRFGHQTAIYAGLQIARGQAVVMMDSDGQHPPKWLPVMLERWQQGAKVVQMIRKPTQSQSWFKRTTSRLFYQMFALLCRVPITSSSSDFRLLDREVADLILRSQGPVPFLRGLVPWLGCETAEVEYDADSRTAGDTKYSFRRMVRLALDGVTSFSVVPLRLGMWAGLCFGLLSFAYLCYVACVGLFNDGAVPGWASTAGLVALLGGVQLFCVGLLGEYLGRVYVNSLDRPRYVVREAIRPCEEEEQIVRRSVNRRPTHRVSPAAAGRFQRIGGQYVS